MDAVARQGDRVPLRGALVTATLADVAIAAVAARAERVPEGPERTWLDARGGCADLSSLRAAIETPCAADRPLVALRRQLALTDGELLAAAIAIAVEHDAALGRALARLQEPVGGARPTLGLLTAALAPLAPSISIAGLAGGTAQAVGLVEIAGAAPLPERALSVPRHLVTSLHGIDATPDGCEIDMRAPIALAPSTREALARHAEALSSGLRRALVVRAGDDREARSVACAIAAALGKRALFVGEPPVPGLAPWALVAGLLPVFVRRPGPSERVSLPLLPGYAGPVLVVAGADGAIEWRDGTVLEWRIGAPPIADRRALWLASLGDEALAGDLANAHRHGAGRIAELSEIARHHAALSARTAPSREDVRAASLRDGGSLGSLAVPLPGAPSDDALVVSDSVRRTLDLLVRRCAMRERLAEGLGPAAQHRFAPGVRILFHGPSGTGKTLAAAWLAGRLSMPLYRVDGAAVSSKYVGETERNLAELLARAEHAEVVLLFDEADSLFGKRTDVRHSTDRFANAQTNYLLQRIESYEGVVVLTSNGRSRFDDAFMRRLDFVIEMPLPGPDERKAIWLAHLGGAHALGERAIHRLAATTDLAGGHVRNVVLAAALVARARGTPIGWDDVMTGLELEYKKLGRSLPSGLSRTP
jgi:hypothetical protein